MPTIILKGDDGAVEKLEVSDIILRIAGSELFISSQQAERKSILENLNDKQIKELRELALELLNFSKKGSKEIGG